MSTGTLSRKCERSKSWCLQAKKKKKGSVSSFEDHSTTSSAALVLCESLNLTPSWESSEGRKELDFICQGGSGG